MLAALPAELILHIYRKCTSIADVVNLSLVSRRLHTLLPTSQRLSILFSAAEAEFGPIHDIVQIVTLNNNQPVHVRREAALSYALLQQVALVARVCKKWEQLYPRSRWAHDYTRRRVLSTDEQYRLRRAIYRYWLYARAFHGPLYPRTTRAHYSTVSERTRLLLSWSTDELVEIEDIRLAMQDVVSKHICPNNGMVKRRFGDVANMSDHPQHVSSASRPSLPLAVIEELFHTTHNRYVDTDSLATVWKRQFGDPSTGGWGDDVSQYYVVQDMMKLDPGEIMWLKENAPRKWQVEGYVEALGDWFINNGETFGETFDLVMYTRGHNLDVTREELKQGHVGIATDDHLHLIACARY